MEIRNKLTVTRGERGEGRGMTGKEEEGSSQGTCIKDPWTRTMRGGGLTVGGGGKDRGEQWGKIGKN